MTITLYTPAGTRVYHDCRIRNLGAQPSSIEFDGLDSFDHKVFVRSIVPYVIEEREPVNEAKEAAKELRVSCCEYRGRK